jgi:ubiquinone/menaquinone biosynthesis C-methylase UbiE
VIEINMPQLNSEHSNKVCPWWFAYSFDNPLRRLVHKPEEILGGLVHPGEIALDLGCGMGYFTIALAELVGPQGKVFAVDVQEKMLAGVRRRLQHKGLASRVQLHQCSLERIGLSEPVDFALAFWMVHEVPDQRAFLEEVHFLLKPSARFLLVEPVGHVSTSAFQQTVQVAQSVGFNIFATRRVRFSQAIILSI